MKCSYPCFFYRFDRSIDNDRIPHASDRIKRANIPNDLKYPDILLIKSHSESWLSNTMVIEISRNDEESHLTNCDQLIFGLLVVVPL